MTINDYLKMAIKKAGNAYRLSGELKVSAGFVHQVQRGTSGIGEENLTKLAHYIGVDEAELILQYHIEKCKPETRSTWEKVFKRYRGAAALLIVLSLTGSGLAAPTPIDQSGENIHYRTLKRYRRFLFPLIFSEECAI